MVNILGTNRLRPSKCRPRMTKTNAGPPNEVKLKSDAMEEDHLGGRSFCCRFYFWWCLGWVWPKSGPKRIMSSWTPTDRPVCLQLAFEPQPYVPRSFWKCLEYILEIHHFLLIVDSRALHCLVDILMILMVTS